MPVIENFVEKYFGKKPITSFNPDESVAIGAALRGETLFNNSPYLDSLNLIDVIPLNIGIMAGEEDLLSVVLKRNTYIPCIKKKIYKPIKDYQPNVEINIYEGTNKYAKDNSLLGKFTLEIVPKKVSESDIEVSFSIDEHLILHVSAEQISEGRSKTISIKKKNQLLSNEELELEKNKIDNTKIVNMNEDEKRKYSTIIDIKKNFFDQENVISEKELNEFIKLIENYISDFKIKENNIHFVMILFRLYNLLILKKMSTFQSLEEKIKKFLEIIYEKDIFYSLNFISKYNLEKSFQEDLTKQISVSFNKYGIQYLSDNFKENKKIAYELFNSSLKLIDDLFIHNDELKQDEDILIIKEANEQNLKRIKIIDLSLKIKDIYNNHKNSNKEKYINHIFDLYQAIINLIHNKYDIEYIPDLDVLYELGNNNNYLINVLIIMKSLNAFIEDINTGNNFNKIQKKEIFETNLKKLTKNYEESRNVNQEYFKNDYRDGELINILEAIENKYNKDKQANNLTNFSIYILENYPPITFPIAIDEFQKKPSEKKLVASYSKSLINTYPLLINKERIRKKIYGITSEMFNNNVRLKPINQIDEDTDCEFENDNIGTESLMTDYTTHK